MMSSLTSVATCSTFAATSQSGFLKTRAMRFDKIDDMLGFDNELGWRLL